MALAWHENVSLTRRGWSRRGFLHGVSAAAAAAGTLSFCDAMSLQAHELRKEGRSLIVLWMQGGPSQFETFDPKPGHENGGPTEAIETSVSGIRIAKGWEQTAKQMEHIALIRSMTNKEGNHDRATYQLHTGYIPSGSVRHPSLAANIAREIRPEGLELPSVVTIGNQRVGSGTGAGFLGVDYEPFHVTQPGGLPDNVAAGTPAARYQRRLGLLGQLEDDFASRGGQVVVENHRRIYGKASSLVLSPQTEAFNLAAESDSLRKEYGDTVFGKGCLLARRLVESGVTYVEVRAGNWDTHQENFEATGRLAGEVDPGMGALIGDLHQRGMLDRTMVVWMGEFGRTPKINPRNGRDHYPRAFSVAVAGGGVKGGQVIGSTGKDGGEISDRPVAVNDLFSSICHSLQVNPAHENMSPLGRPMKIVDGGEIVKELFA